MRISAMGTMFAVALQLALVSVTARGEDECSVEELLPTPAPTLAPLVPGQLASGQTSVDGIEPVATESGLRYYDIKVGTGKTPRSGARVSVHYTGWFTDGTAFDSSRIKGEPFKFQTHRGVIKGWIEGISTMREGGIRRLEVPSELAYGEHGMGKRVPPNADLIFELELLAIDEQGPIPPEVDDAAKVTTRSGLVYWEITKGADEPIAKEDRVKMEFAVWLENGRLLATSGDPQNLRIMQVSALFAGWAEGVVGMRKGGERKLLIPPALAFGEKGGSGVPPNESIIMHIKIADVLRSVRQTSVDGIEPVVTKSGLKYWDILVGDGPLPSATSQCRVHYTSWLADGTMLDSSLQKGKELTLHTNGGFVEGFVEGVYGMRVGGKRRLEIPPDLGYGDLGQPRIPPRSTLIFEVELLGVEELHPAKTKQPQGK